MQISVMPVLHARTFNIDFRSGKLLVEPEEFTETDSMQVYNIAKESTRQLEMAPECGRYIVFGAGAYAVIGRTVRFIDLYTACKRTPQFSYVDKKDGRPAYGFVGIMIPRGTISDPFYISDDLILYVYEHCIRDRWNENIDDQNAFATKKMGLFDIDVEKMPCQLGCSSLIMNAAMPTVLEDSNELREQILFSAMKSALNGERVSLCTSVSTIDENVFSIVTCKNVVFKSKELAEAIGEMEYQDGANPMKNKCSSSPKNTETNHGGKVKSPDDVLETTVSPEENNGIHCFLPKKNRDKGCNLKSEGRGGESEKAMILGTVLGITFIIIEVAYSASPLLMAVTGTCTIIIGGIAAKRIIDRFLDA